MDILNRFSAALWANELLEKKASIVGLGATGSWVSLFLARNGIGELTLIDFDTIEFHNIGSQFFAKSQIGLSKVSAAKENILDFSSINAGNVFVRKDSIENVTGDLYYSNYIICTVDKMSVRKYIFEKCKNENKIFIDSRIGAEYWEVYYVDMTNADLVTRYEATLFSDDQGSMGACNYQQSSLSAAGAAIQICELINQSIVYATIGETPAFLTKKDLRISSYEVFN